MYCSRLSLLTPQVLELELHLLLDRQDAVGQQAAQLERIALVIGERHVLCQQPVTEEGRPGEADARESTRGNVVEGRRQGAHAARSVAARARPGAARRSAAQDVQRDEAPAWDDR